MDERASFEGLLSSAGSALASAVALLIVFAIFQNTGRPNTQLALEAAAAEVSGDISVLASSAVPYNDSHRYSFGGIALNISSDYVVASEGGETFARPLPTGLCPGRYCDGDLAWVGPESFVQYLNRTYDAPGTREAPLSEVNASAVKALLDGARQEMELRPLAVDLEKSIVIEKLFIFSHDDTNCELEADSYVFVYQR